MTKKSMSCILFTPRHIQARLSNRHEGGKRVNSNWGHKILDIKNMQGRYHFRDTGIDRRKLLKYISMKQALAMRSGLKYNWVSSSVGFR